MNVPLSYFATDVLKMGLTQVITNPAKQSEAQTLATSVTTTFAKDTDKYETLNKLID